jgi:NAD(P)-dependent dehydrogenase (short-subunit alcohol dehydrogenase family)
MQGTSELSHSVILVTGGTRGIGLGITKRFIELGAQVIIVGRRPPDEPIEGATFIAADLRQAASVSTVFETIRTQFGRLDVLVNNAGGSPPADAATASPNFTSKIITLNLLAPLWCAQAAYGIMAEQDSGGSIINMASVSGTRPSPGTAAYGAAKAGLLNLTQSLAVEWAPVVRVNAITPGLVKTEHTHLHYGNDAGVAAAEGTIPMGRMATPRDIAHACVYLASAQSAYITGTNLMIHGGGERPAFLAALDRV